MSAPWQLMMEFEGLPPSTNAAYFNKIVQKGKKRVTIRVLSAEGRAYHKLVKGHIAKHYGLQLQGLHRSRPYVFTMVIFTPDLFNRGWPKQAETPYKRLDGTNRFKLLEDAIAEALAIDDSQFMQSTVIKRYAEQERTQVWIWESTDDHYQHPTQAQPLGGVPAMPPSGYPVPSV